MSANRQYAAPSSVDARHLASSNINSGSPTSQPAKGGHSANRDTSPEDAALHILYHTAAKLGYMQDVGYKFDVAAFGANAIDNYSRKAEISRADYQSTNRRSGVSQQAGSYGITNLSDTFDETQNFIQGRTNLEILVRDAKFSSETPPLLPTAGTQLQPVATSGTHARQVGTANPLEGLCSVRLKKRGREQTSNLSHVKHTESSDDGARGSKRTKVDCDCEDDHTWWMTIKIGEMNEVLHRIDTAIGLVMKTSYGSNDLGNFATEYNLIDLLKESRGILDSAKDDMKTEGGRDREATE